MRNPCVRLTCSTLHGRMDVGTPAVEGNWQVVGFEPGNLIQGVPIALPAPPILIHCTLFPSRCRLCQQHRRTFPVTQLCVRSAQRRAKTRVTGQACPFGHPMPAVDQPSPMAAHGPWDVRPWGGWWLVLMCVAVRLGL